MKLNINGISTEINSDGNTPLLWVLRDELNLTGTKYGCGIAACGACTVHVNGQATRSCVLPVSSLEGSKVTTIEGMTTPAGLHPVQQAWITEQVPQCGYCQSGMIMAASALIAQTPKPSEQDIDNAMSNICRCGTYQRVRKAIHTAVSLMASSPAGA